ncbi:MAG: hypothetical protein EPO25_17340 [Gammaproteobacteria bacterium]|nr:MAG: hypothetical protein EPO25_17340 [Gammaproteobacteria bacterium]
MLGIHDYWLFVAAGIVLNLTPGQDTYYILGRSIAQGARSGAASATAFVVVKLAGAAYLAYLGVRMMLAVAAGRVRRLCSSHPERLTLLSRVAGGLLIGLGLRRFITLRMWQIVDIRS